MAVELNCEEKQALLRSLSINRAIILSNLNSAFASLEGGESGACEEAILLALNKMLEVSVKHCSFDTVESYVNEEIDYYRGGRTNNGF